MEDERKVVVGVIEDESSSLVQRCCSQLFQSHVYEKVQLEGEGTEALELLLEA